MKKYSILLLLIISIACSTQNQQHVFTIKGKIENAIKDGKIVFYERDLEHRKFLPLEEFTLNNNGSFERDFNYEPGLYAIEFFDKKTINLAIDKGQTLTITGDFSENAKKEISVSGSKDTDLLNEYENYRKEIFEKYYVPVRDSVTMLSKEGRTKELEELTPKFTERTLKYRKLLTDFIKNKMGTSVAVYYTSTRWEGNDDLKILSEVVNNFEREHPDLKITELLREKIDKLKGIAIGSEFKEISLPDTSGNLISLSSFKGKYILLDFWASWCPPCRQENPLLLEYYNKYKNKNFEIFSVSMDSKRESWVKAIKNDDMVWTNVSDLQAWGNPESPAHEYDVNDIPINFLINPEGKIIAKRLRGKELEEKLNEILN